MVKIIDLTVGGLTKKELLNTLKQKNILINSYGEKFLQSKLFKVTKEKKKMQLVELTLIELGLTDGTAGLLEIIDQAKAIGLKPCSPDTAPFLRVSSFDDKDSQGQDKNHRTPDGAVTVVSKILDEDVYFPKGFYLRKIDGKFWLRGYICDYEHHFGVNERFIFEKS